MFAQLGIGGTSSSVSKDEKLHPYAYYNHDLINADSVPDRDWYGPDGGGWTAGNWVYWFNRNVDAYGDDVARNKWNDWHEKNTTFGSSFNDFKFDKNFRDFTRKHELWNGENIISDVLVTAEGVVKTAKNLTDKAEKATSEEDKSTDLSKWGLMNWLLLFGFLYFVTKFLGVIAFYRPYKSTKNRRR